MSDYRTIDILGPETPPGSGQYSRVAALGRPSIASTRKRCASHSGVLMCTAPVARREWHRLWKTHEPWPRGSFGVRLDYRDLSECQLPRFGRHHRCTAHYDYFILLWTLLWDNGRGAKLPVQAVLLWPLTSWPKAHLCLCGHPRTGQLQP